MPRQARERLLSTARELFADRGIRATSVEDVLDASGVGRASFYRHFAGKDDLVVAALTHYSERWRALLRDQLPARGAGVLGVFDVLSERFADPDYRGCLALTALIEYRDPAHPVHRAAVAHQDATATDLATLLDPALPPAERARLADQLLQLVDAAMLTALHHPDGDPAGSARRTAAALMAQAGDPTRTT